MAYTFLKAAGKPVGKSLVEDDLSTDRARSPVARRRARRPAGAAGRSCRRASASPPTCPPPTLDVGDAAIGDRMGLDIGPQTVRLFSRHHRGRQTVVWNGPMGVFEMAPFAAGTMGVAHAVASVKGTTIIGGGDSVAAVIKAGVADRMTHISTGGGASLEFLAGRKLPGVEALRAGVSNARRDEAAGR